MERGEVGISWWANSEALGSAGGGGMGMGVR